MTRIIGVDGALSNTGMAVWRDGRLSVKNVHTRPDDGPEPRWRAIGSHLWQLLGGDDEDTLVAIEGVFVNPKVPGPAIALAMLHGTLRLGLHQRQVPFVVIDPPAVKQYACGVGRATKREMVIATARMGLRFQVADDNQADALWLVAMTLAHYGLPICDTFPAGVDALARQAWPVIAGWPTRDELAASGQLPGAALTNFERDERAVRRVPVPSPFLPAGGA